MSNVTKQTHETVITAMLCALSFIAVLIGNLVPNVQGFLSYDPKDAIVVIAGFIFGPLTSFTVSVIVSFVEMFTISGTGIYGCVMNIISTCAFACPAALAYKHFHRMGGAVLGLALGVMTMAGTMVLWNWLITPFYMGIPRSEVAAMLPTLFLPFNLIKGGINAGLTLVLYKPIVSALRSASLLPQPEEGKRGRFNPGFTAFSLLVLVTFVLLFLVFTGLL